MVLKLIGFVALLLCTQANANESNKGSQNNCNWAHGVGTCKWIYACEAYIKKEVSFNDLTRCSKTGRVPRICCPITTNIQRQTQRTNTNQLSPTERKSNPTVSTFATNPSLTRRDQVQSAVGGVCNTTSKTANCYENSYCVSNLGNGICKRGENCEPYANYRRPQWLFSHCNSDTICCVLTETEANTIQFATTTKRTTSTTSSTAQYGSPLNFPPSVPSSGIVGNSCNTNQRTGNCYEGNPCTSPSGSGTCKPLTRCESVNDGPIHECSRHLICCLSSSATTPGMNRSKTSGTTGTQNSTRSSNVPLRQNTENTVSLASPLGKMCNTLSGPGTCVYFIKCDAYIQRKIKFNDMIRCDEKLTFCCPNSLDTRPIPSGGLTTTTARPKSLEGSYCSNFPYASGICSVLDQCRSYLQGSVRYETLQRCSDTSNPRKELVCCPQVPSTSAKPRTISTTTMRTEPIPKPKPQVRPSEKACEIYKATYPNRLLTHTPGVVNATNGEFPHVGIVMGPSNGGGSSLRLFCGAALIAKKFALTAANCARSLPQGAVIRFGSVDTNPSKPIGQRLDAHVKNIWLQDDNKESEDYHDLAILEFVKDISLSSSVHPACLRVEEEDLPRSVDLYVNGWTTNDESNNYVSPVLYTSTVNTALLIGCNFTHYSLGVSRRFIGGVQLGQYCARNSKREECDGDYGFPLMRDTNGQFEIVGIMSLEFGCSSTLPSIYTRVAYYIDWIEDIVWPNLTKNV